jgi:hypothetical protein
MTRRLPFSFALLIFSLLVYSSCQPLGNIVQEENPLQWQELFNGRNLNDWTVKIRGYEVGENHANTFLVEDGYLTVSYDGYEDFAKQYGHIFYKEPFSAYLLRVEYRFIGDQAPGGEEWAYRNSGVMLHGQSPESMGLHQDFPISVEGQILGGDGQNKRPTSNLCTPGTHVIIDNELFTPHCLNSTSDTYHGDQWVRADFLVLADSLIEHRIGGEVVLSYSKPQIGGGNVSGHDPKVKEDGKILSKGYISLQSESHPIQFRKVNLLNLEPYMEDQEKLEKVLKEVL